MMMETSEAFDEEKRCILSEAELYKHHSKTNDIARNLERKLQKQNFRDFESE